MYRRDDRAHMRVEKLDYDAAVGALLYCVYGIIVACQRFKTDASRRRVFVLHSTRTCSMCEVVCRPLQRRNTKLCMQARMRTGRRRR